MFFYQELKNNHQPLFLHFFQRYFSSLILLFNTYHLKDGFSFGILMVIFLILIVTTTYSLIPSTPFIDKKLDFLVTKSDEKIKNHPQLTIIIMLRNPL